MIPIKTRAEIYGNEAAALLQIISMYPGLSERQLFRFFPEKESKAANLLSYLKRQGRIRQTDTGGYLPYGAVSKYPKADAAKAVWVLLDFLDRAEFHSASEFPVSVIFFADGELYEIIPVPDGQETLISQALRQNGPALGKRLILVDRPEQITRLSMSGVSAFCTADDSGRVHYYQKQTEGLH